MRAYPHGGRRVHGGAGGLPEPNPEHARNIARVALRMLRYIERRNAAHTERWECRIGINSGPVVGSLVGV